MAVESNLNLLLSLSLDFVSAFPTYWGFRMTLLLGLQHGLKQMGIFLQHHTLL